MHQLIFDLKALFLESYPSISALPPPGSSTLPICGDAPATYIAQTCRALSCLRLPKSPIDLEGV